MIEKYYKESLYFQLKGFGDNKIKHIFSSRIGWDQKNIFKLIENIFDVDGDEIYRPKQVHGTDILIIDEQNNLEVENMEFDGLITNKKNIVLSTYHADCVPLYFYDGKNNIIGVAHSGWKGTLNNISGKMIDMMRIEFSSKIEDIQVGIGPSICAKCYEVQKDVSEPFINKFGEEVIIKDKNRLYLDLWTANKINLKRGGISKENIYSADICTSCNNNKLYSYRKENNTKNRMITGIMLLE